MPHAFPTAPTRARRAAGAALLCASLAACGGGSGDGPEEPATGAAGPDPDSAASAAGCAGAALPPPRDADAACAPLDDASRATLLELVNDARAEARRCGTEDFPAAPALAWNPCLEAAAADHSEDMAVHDFFSHTGSDGSSIGDRASAANFPWSAVGENIAAGQATAAAAMTGWLDSPGHCRNIMSPRYASLGMACSADAGTSWGTYWTQVFARSR